MICASYYRLRWLDIKFIFYQLLSRTTENCEIDLVKIIYVIIMFG